MREFFSAGGRWLEGGTTGVTPFDFNYHDVVYVTKDVGKKYISQRLGDKHKGRDTSVKRI